MKRYAIKIISAVFVACFLIVGATNSAFASVYNLPNNAYISTNTSLQFGRQYFTLNNAYVGNYFYILVSVPHGSPFTSCNIATGAYTSFDFNDGSNFIGGFRMSDADAIANCTYELRADKSDSSFDTYKLTYNLQNFQFSSWGATRPANATIPPFSYAILLLGQDIGGVGYVYNVFQDNNLKDSSATYAGNYDGLLPTKDFFFNVLNTIAPPPPTYTVDLTISPTTTIDPYDPVLINLTYNNVPTEIRNSCYLSDTLGIIGSTGQNFVNYAVVPLYTGNTATYSFVCENAHSLDRDITITLSGSEIPQPPLDTPTECTFLGMLSLDSTAFSGCFNYLFKPSQASIDQFSNLSDILKKRSPIGYFYAIKNALPQESDIGSDSGDSAINNVVINGHNLRYYIKMILWVGFTFILFKRFKNYKI